ncbi:MAG TPA: transposase [Nitrososphaerales archaeon]|nr:transposase [Nitrososphaerales archaeon]
MLKVQSESPSRGTIKAVKSTSFPYVSSHQLSSLFEHFRLMCNDAIRIADKEKPRNRIKLVELAYGRLKQYGLHTHYILSACEVAYSVYKNKMRKCVPYIKRAFLKLDNQSYQLNHLLLRIPTNPRNFVFLTLQGSNYHTSFVDDPNLKRGSVTITERSVCISFTKVVPALRPFGYVGTDLNERNITVSATNGYEHQFTELGEVAEIKERYREIRAKISTNTRRDRRICKKLLARYGRREERRTTQRIHKLTNEIVSYAKANRFGIKMERLKGIRKLYRKGNGQGKSFRGRMNTWVFGETQRQIDYKARWEGVPDLFVNPRGTSSNCPDCGSHVVRLADRKLYCSACEIIWDRDVLASRNIMACAVPQVRPLKGSNEVERGDDGSNPLSRWGEGTPRG